MKLTDKQEAFIREYLVDLNSKQAAIRAGYSTLSAVEMGHENMMKPHVRARIDEELAERSKRTGVNQDRVIRELARIAFVDPTKLMNMQTATILESAEDDDKAVIASIKVKSGEDFTEREIKLCDKLKALELLGKHLGMYVDRVAISEDKPVIVDDISGKD